MSKRNGVLPSKSECKNALLGPHTRDLMIRTIRDRPGGQDLLDEVWVDLEEETRAVHRELLRRKYAAKRDFEGNEKPAEVSEAADAETQVHAILQPLFVLTYRKTGGSESCGITAEPDGRCNDIANCIFNYLHPCVCCC